MTVDLSSSNRNNQLNFSQSRTGAAPRRRLGEQSPTPHKGYFCKSSKTDEKKLGLSGKDNVSNQI